MIQLTSVARKVFGSANDRRLRGGQKLVPQINALEPGMKELSDEGLRAKTDEFRERQRGGETLDQLLPEAFAVVREASVRTLGLRHFDVQLQGGWILHNGSIAEMKTGEGKTLVATLPVYLNALSGDGVHVVTVNDYLAQRDADWMGAIYSFLGLTTGCVVPGIDDEARKEAYAADVTYGTNNELGFDYLRDNMKTHQEALVQRGHAYAIVDEVDSILIDEARTPLIISGAVEDQSDLYRQIDAIVPKLTAEHYAVDEKLRTATLTESGNEFVEQLVSEAGLLETGNLYDAHNAPVVHHINQALRARLLFKRDRDYIVRNSRVTIIDEFTGRMMEGRRYGEGLHQAIEAKESVGIQPENVTLASITFQNYFRLYGKLAGMTGTALTEAEEFQEIYGLETVEVPTHMPMIREDNDDLIYRTAEEKAEAIVEAIRDAQERKQPVLVGTTSIEKSETLSEQLKKLNIQHNVLNARYHEQEAAIIAQAGVSGAVTIATNMAGRGTDIQLGGNLEGRVAAAVGDETDEAKIASIREQMGVEIAADRERVVAAGGLWIIGTERHESRRIDNQLRGRSGRQGDPGRSTFFLSLEDDLMRIFGGERIDSMLGTLGIERGEAIYHPWINKAVEKSQSRVEARNFDIRKNLLKYDDVMNDQRKIVFEQRREIMEVEDISELINDMRDAVIDLQIDKHLPEGSYSEAWDIPGLTKEAATVFGVEFPFAEWAAEEGIDEDEMHDRFTKAADQRAKERAESFGTDLSRKIERLIVLNAVDKVWRDHLVTLDHLRSVIGLRGFAQRNPLNEYKAEAFTLFQEMLTRLRVEVTRLLMHVQVNEAPPPRPIPAPAPAPAPMIAGGRQPAPVTEAGANALAAALPASGGVPKVGRNDPCPCGSGKKYKKCHGR